MRLMYSDVVSGIWKNVIDSEETDNHYNYNINMCIYPSNGQYMKCQCGQMAV